MHCINVNSKITVHSGIIMVLPTDTGRNRCRVTATPKVEMTMLKFGIDLPFIPSCLMVIEIRRGGGRETDPGQLTF